MSAIVRKATPVLTVERIEPCVLFWKKLDLVATVEVPDTQKEDGRLAFVILAKDGIEIMYQTIASIEGDLVKSASVKEAFPKSGQHTLLFVEVGDLEDVEARMQGERLIMPRRTTFYGSTETGYADPAGNIIVFAQHQSGGETE